MKVFADLAYAKFEFTVAIMAYCINKYPLLTKINSYLEGSHQVYAQVMKKYGTAMGLTYIMPMRALIQRVINLYDQADEEAFEYNIDGIPWKEVIDVTLQSLLQYQSEHEAVARSFRAPRADNPDLTVYLASPYSHPEKAVQNARFKAAALVTAELMQSGMSIYSPIVHSHTIAALSPTVHANAHDFWMEQDLPILRQMDVLAILEIPGWKTSIGIEEEIVCSAPWMPIYLISTG